MADIYTHTHTHAHTFGELAATFLHARVCKRRRALSLNEENSYDLEGVGGGNLKKKAKGSCQKCDFIYDTPLVAYS